MRTILLVFVLILLHSTDALAVGPDITTRYFSGRVGSQDIVMHVWYERETLSDKFRSYNIYGEVFNLSEQNPLPRELMGKLQANGRVLALQEHRRTFHQGWGGVHDESYMERKEQTGFFEGAIINSNAVEPGQAPELEFEGTWIKTNVLTPEQFFQGEDRVDGTHLHFVLHDGGTQSMQDLTGKFACQFSSPTDAQQLAITLNNGQVSELSWQRHELTKPYYACALHRDDFVESPGHMATVLKGIDGSNSADCQVTVLNFEKRFLIAASPWKCGCSQALLVDKMSGECHNFWPKQARP